MTVTVLDETYLYYSIVGHWSGRLIVYFLGNPADSIVPSMNGNNTGRDKKVKVKVKTIIRGSGRDHCSPILLTMDPFRLLSLLLLYTTVLQLLEAKVST